MLDTPFESEFDSLTELASAIAGCPIALISLVDETRQWFKSAHGVSVRETPRAISFCGHAILAPDDPFVVEDATRDPRFFDNPLVVGEANVRHYTGIALKLGPDALPVGTLCVIDHIPRTLSSRQLEHLSLLSRHVERLLELRLRAVERSEQLAFHRLKEAELQAVLEAVDEGIVVHGRDGRIVSANPSALRILGVSMDELRGVGSSDARLVTVRGDGSPFPPLERPAMVALRTNAPVAGVVMGIGATPAERRWILINARPFGQTEDGGAASVAVSFADITTLRHEEGERRIAQAQIEQFFSVALEPLCIVSMEGRFLRVNPAWTAALGWSQEELLAAAPGELLHPDDRERTREHLANLHDVEHSAVIENRYRCKDGSYRTMSWRTTTVPSSRSIIAVARDVTPDRAREATLRAAKEAAEAAGRAKSEFLATMSHEIRTPMNGVLGLTEILLGTSVTDEQRGLLRSVRDSGHALLQVLNDVLDWSSIEAGHLKIEPTAIDPRRVANDVLSVLVAGATTKGITIELDAPRAMKNILADEGRIRQVLFNLVGNAIKFTDHGSVQLRLSSTEPTEQFPSGGCRIEVRDTGIGIAAGDLARLFERFAQVDASATRRFRGTGLGLAISRQLVRAMKGTIDVESRIGEGSTFTVVLPFTSIKRKSAVLREAVVIAPPTRSLRVLIAEDELINQKVASSLVAREGHIVETAVNGRLAVSTYENGEWDLVLMDVQMPEMDGLDATRAIRAFEQVTGRRRAMVVALTASVLPEQLRTCLDAGMDEVLPKPFTKEALLALLARTSDDGLPIAV